MSIPEKILLGVALGYLGIGAILSFMIGFEDIRNSRVSWIGFVDSLASLFGPFKFLYLLLWPLWYFSYRSAEKKGQLLVASAYGPDRVKYLRKEPIQPPETTRGK